ANVRKGIGPADNAVRATDPTKVDFYFKRRRRRRVTDARFGIGPDRAISYFQLLNERALQ
ncbi:MAG: hypothetical protein J6X44_00615, partial [Thermoguttaceae bacterium]|nr:hypothetical protein [Thermoguttaceae bacterium]